MQAAAEVKTDSVLLPLGNRVVIVPDEFKYEGRIVIPDKNQATPTTGTIIAVGRLVDAVKVGDRVVYSHYSGTLIKISGRPAYRLLSQEELLAIISVTDPLEYSAS